MGFLRLEILVKPNARHVFVGGSYDGALVVRVSEPAEGGKATRAALRAVAESFGVPPGKVRLVRGPTSRRKICGIESLSEPEELLRERLHRLLRNGG